MSLLGRVLSGLRERPRSDRRPAGDMPDAALAAAYAAAQRALDAGDLAAAVPPLRAIVASGGDRPEVHCNLGVALRALGERESAADHLRRAIASQPDLGAAWYNLGLLEFERGRYAEAAAAYRGAIEADPGVEPWRNSLLCLLNYAPDHTPQQVFEAHRAWGERFAPAPRREWRRAPRASRRLRIGYVSADFRGHSVAFFMRPVLAHHDRGRYEIFCYHNHAAPDATTLELQALAEHWRDVAALDDAALERLILDDAIDVLVDLSGHTLGNRLPVFARRPAPVQATWIGYPQTTGLAAMDYRISDALLDPPGATEALGTEAILRLPECAVCFVPPEEAPRADAPPVVRSGRITFGSVNQYFKITGAVVRTWSRLLVAVPDAVLRMTLDQGERAEVAAEVQARFAAHGVAPDRIVVRGRSDLRGFFRELAELDLVLDPFPYNGGTTTYHCLWAGVPVVTLAGRTAIARCGAMILSHVGLAELVTADEDAYVSCATALARDTERLAELRRTLPVRYRASPLYAADRFTRALETAYDEMWRAFCAREAAPWPS